TATMTGRWPTATELTSNSQLNQQKADFTAGLSDVMKDQGYKMAAIGKTFHSPIRHHRKLFDHFSTYGSMGKSHSSNPKVKKFNDYLRSTEFYAHLKPAPFPYQMQQPYRMVSETQDWINSLNQNDPFFVYLSFAQPHNPRQASEPYFSMFPPDRLPSLKAGPETIHKKGKKFLIQKKLLIKGLPHFEERLPRLRSIYYEMMRFIDDQV